MTDASKDGQEMGQASPEFRSIEEIREAAGRVFTAVAQPATQYLDRNIEPPRKCTNDPRRQFRCYTCGRVRWAKNMIVHVYYDGIRFFCAEGHVMYRNAWRTKESTWSPRIQRRRRSNGIERMGGVR